MKMAPALGCAVLAMAACALFAADWPQFLGPDRTGISPETKLARSWPEGGLKPLWTVDLGVGYGPAAIEAGKVYILDRQEDKLDILRCLNLKDGKEEWTYSYDAPGKVDHPGSRSTPTVDEKYVFTVGSFGDFHCVDKKTHQPVWKKNLCADFGSQLPPRGLQWGISQSPVPYKDTVIVAPQSKTVGVAAFEKSTGKLVWQSAAIGAPAYCTPLLAKIGNVDQAVMITGGGATGVHVGTGKILWTFGDWKCDISVPSATDCGDGRFFLTGGYNAGSAMFRVTAEGDKFAAKLLWKSKEVGSHVQNAILWKDHLYVNSDNTKAGLVCLDLDGKVKWKTVNAPSFDKGNLIIADGLIYILDGRRGSLCLVEADPTAYKELARTPVLSAAPVWAPMALSDGKLVVRDQKQMKCLDVGAP